MTISEILKNPKQYLSKKIHLNGYLQTDTTNFEPVLYISDKQIPEFKPEKALRVVWQDETIPIINRERRIRQLQSVLAHPSVGIELNSINAHIKQQIMLRGSFISYFNDLNSGWENVESSFIDEQIEAKALSLYKLLQRKRLLESFVRHKIFSNHRIPHTNYHNRRHSLVEIHGYIDVNQFESPAITTSKIIVYTDKFNLHLVTGDRDKFFSEFGANAIAVRDILINPHDYLGRSLTIQGFYAGGVNFNIQKGLRDIISYSRIVPNHFYYQFRGRWDNRVSLHMKNEPVARILSSFYEEIPGFHKSRPDQPTIPPRKPRHFDFGSDVKITGTIHPPENDFSSYLIDDITALNILHKDVIYEWKLPILRTNQ